MILSNIENLGKWSKNEIEVICDECGVEKKIKYKLYTSYGYENGKYLCRKCKLKKNNLEKWGVENVFQSEEIKNKIKKSNLEKWGVENPSQNEEINKKIKKSISILDKDIINEKRKETLLKKYGVKNISQLDEIKSKKSETLLNKIGVNYIFEDKSFQEKIKKLNIETYKKEYYFQTDEFKEKSKITSLEKYGVDIPSKNEEIINKIKKSVKEKSKKEILENNKDNIIYINDSILGIKCDHCDNIFEINNILFYKRREKKTEICTICNPIDRHQSGKEIKLMNIISDFYKGEIIQNYKIDKQEIDIYLPDLKIGFEFNGLYWHSSKYKDKYFHINKTNFFNNKGIRIIHIWEDDLDNKENIIKSQIKNLIKVNDTKIFARKCEIMEVNNIESSLFLNKNHIQGNDKSIIKIGLYYKSELVSLMTFNKLEGRKIMLENEWNLSRFCNSLNTNVVGGASRLFNFFIKKYNPIRIVSYADKDWSIGGLYYKLGFKLINDTKPDYKYVINEKRIHKSNYKKSKTGIKENDLNLNKIWDCGKLKFEYIK